ncbi:MAG: amidohydrolase [Proteobacteria bacterium]|nr:amidohydrolase [Pseudomonadota bacterium]MBI3496276.1 amidohydrolase [Pseudomonadota bacterium]
MILDAHCHAWERWPYQPEVPDPDSRGRAENLLWEMDGAGVTRAVIICASIAGNPENNRYAFARAASSGGRLIPFADVDSRWMAVHHTPGAAERLQLVIETFNPRGITHYMNEDADAGWLLSPDGLGFARLAARHGLIFRLACGPSQLPTIAGLAERVPDLTILLHHLGRVRGDIPTEESGLALLLEGARLPNLYVKVSGFGYGSRRPWEFPYAKMLDVFHAVYDRYGAERLLWGSDYPVVNRFMTYRQSLEILRSCCPFVSSQDMEKILGGTLGRLLGDAESSGRG